VPPEIDVYHKLSSAFRFSFQAKETREDGAPTQAEIGPRLDFYLKPLVKLKKIAWFDLDDSKTRFLVLSMGYRYLPSPSSTPVNRIEPRYLSLSPEGRVPAFRPESCRPGLAEGQLHLALSEPNPDRKTAHDPLLSPCAVYRCGVLLPEPI
jgi:hypothetical protein